ncbi:BlaI/MecI/CopY family transcriptional regulator [Paratissierella segnis]|jgi:predicted transcriptional regulator|uniref:BlaI/MecI/CopY family transcriptional regulator n=1 Tax=Paratissierella segnis TaxID=2763679 RepID=A0A926IFN9_9FIRM|nr:BlaI/MecI/CopY family transcriptional regulator [Paratissierella segnis]MBC8588702.1 BlaI/MecI/CopY family transcriptional regulator [Paratissierella segnis]
MEEFKLFDAEYKFMSIIWDYEPINSTKLSKLTEEILGWKKSTTYNMIKKLSEKGLLMNENATVKSLIKKEQVQKYESEAIIEKSFDGSLPVFLTAFLDNKNLSKGEALELKRIIEEATK